MPRLRIPVLRDLIEDSSSGGIVLIAAAVLALVVANGPFADLYARVLDAEIAGLSVLHWINDGLMALFFLFVGLEIKRESLDGQMATWPSRILPGCAALGGMAVPALVYLAFNLGEAGQPRGWAIPAATDIAFALAILSLLGPRVPMSLRIFLTALAIIDDLGAVIIIALFYTASLDVLSAGASGLVLLGLAGLNRFGVTRLLPYLMLGAVLWVLVLRSGVHPTLAGVALAFAIPLRSARGDADTTSPLERLEHALQPWVTFLVVPLFGFANAGVALGGLSLASLADPVPLGVALGLFLGKQIGVFAVSAAVIRAGWAALPIGAGWRQFYGVSLLCGIGFTMSLFIGLLAFAGDPALQAETKVGVLIGSFLSAAVGAAVLRASSAPPRRR